MQFPNLYGGNDNIVRQQQMELEMIRKRNIEETFQYIVKNKPELCRKYSMLYIRGKVSGIDLDIFIDTGAQTTIMTRKFAEKAGLLRLLDTRFKGTAHGVGSAPVLGRIHLMKIQIGEKTYEHNLSVMDKGAIHHLVLGIDFMKVHDCVLDLPRNALRIGEDNEVKFLKEEELIGVKSPVHSPLSDFIRNQNFNPFQQQQSQQQQQQQQPQVTSTQHNNNESFSEEQRRKIQLMTSSFFVSQEKAINALKKANWNPELACCYLFQ